MIDVGCRAPIDQPRDPCDERRGLPDCRPAPHTAPDPARPSPRRADRASIARAAAAPRDGPWPRVSGPPLTCRSTGAPLHHLCAARGLEALPRRSSGAIVVDRLSASPSRTDGRPPSQPFRAPWSCPALEEELVSRSRSRLLALVSATVLISALVPAASAAKPTPPPAPTRPKADRAIFFASDGMRPDLMERFASEGDMPTYQAVMNAGVQGRQRPEAGVPAQHGRRVVHAGDRGVARRAWIDEQHLPSDRRVGVQQPGQSGGVDPPGRHHPAGR